MELQQVQVVTHRVSKLQVKYTICSEMKCVQHPLCSVSSGPPTVTISPLEEQVVDIGGSVTLTCSASDCVGGGFSFVWYRDGSNVSTSGVLTISNVTSSDFGEYTCNVTGNGGTGSATTYISEASELFTCKQVNTTTC